MHNSEGCVLFIALQALRRESDGEFHGGIFGMNFSVAGADDQFRLGLCPSAHPLWQILRAHQAEQPYQRRVPRKRLAAKAQPAMPGADFAFVGNSTVSPWATSLRGFGAATMPAFESAT